MATIFSSWHFGLLNVEPHRALMPSNIQSTDLMTFEKTRRIIQLDVVFTAQLKRDHEYGLCKEIQGKKGLKPKKTTRSCIGMGADTCSK